MSMFEDTMTTTAYIGFHVNTRLQSHDGWDYVVEKIAEFAKEFCQITENWDWPKALNGSSYSWADCLDNLIEMYFTDEHISNKSLNNVKHKVEIILAKCYPHMIELKKFHYNIPTGNNLYGGYDDGIVEAIDINHAYELARKEITEGFNEINRILHTNNLPCFGYDLSELNVKPEI